MEKNWDGRREWDDFAAKLCKQGKTYPPSLAHGPQDPYGFAGAGLPAGELFAQRIDVDFGFLLCVVVSLLDKKPSEEVLAIYAKATDNSIVLDGRVYEIGTNAFSNNNTLIYRKKQ